MKASQRAQLYSVLKIIKDHDPPWFPIVPAFSPSGPTLCLQLLQETQSESHFVRTESNSFNMGTQNSSSTISYDAATAWPASLFNQCTSRFSWFFNHLHNAPSSFGGAPTPLPAPSHPLMTAKTMMGRPYLKPLRLQQWWYLVTWKEMEFCLLLGCQNQISFQWSHPGNLALKNSFILW